MCIPEVVLLEVPVNSQIQECQISAREVVHHLVRCPSRGTDHLG